MKKLEDIPKTDIFKVPDGYFDTLPAIIQARVEKKESGWMPVWRYSLKYGVAVLIVAIGSLWFLNSGSKANNTEQLLASIHDDDLIEYIQDSEMSVDDLLESIDYNQINADSLRVDESHLPQNEDDLTDILFEFESDLKQP